VGTDALGASSVVATTRPVARGALDALEFELHRGRAGLAAIREDWVRLIRAWGTPRFFDLPQWHESYLGTLAETGATTLFLLARRGSRPVAVLPLRLSARRVARLPVRCLALPHNAHMLLGGCVCAPAESEAGILDGMVGQLRRAGIRWDVLFFPNLLADSCAWRALAGMQRVVPTVGDVTCCDYLPVVPHDVRLETLSKNFRGNLRKARNKLERLPGVTYVTARRLPELTAALKDLLDVEASGWKGRDGTSSAVKLDARVAAFYAALAENFGRINACEINLLRADGKCLAGQFCLLVGDTSYMLKIGYDEAYAHVAPGNMLFERTLQRYAQDETIRCVNLITDAPWHANWKPASIPVSGFRVFNATPVGLLAYALTAARRQWTGRRRPKAPTAPAQEVLDDRE
jgi:CelD/BcsL family acetyltransferase involved in cellulose biosynthesis